MYTERSHPILFHHQIIHKAYLLLGIEYALDVFDVTGNINQ